MRTREAAPSVAVMPGRSFRIGRIAGIPVGVSPWWLAIVALISWSLGSAYFPEEVHGIAPSLSYALGFASALLLFASILLHEFGHAIIARRHGIQVQEIDLWLLGGVSVMHGEAHEPGDELRYALAGPAVTAAIAGVFAVISLLLEGSASAVVHALVDYQLLVNCLILGFNLLPAFPLDGGRVLRALLWRRSGDLEAATATAAGVGRGFGYALVALGALAFVNGLLTGLWLAVIGLFLIGAAGAQAMNAQVRTVFSGVDAGKLMSAPVITVPAAISVEQAVGDYFLPYRYTSFPAVDGEGRLLGLLTVDAAEALPRQQRVSCRVADIIDRDPELAVAEDEDIGGLLERPAFARVKRAVVVNAGKVPVGLLSITDVQRSMRVSRLSSRPPTARDVRKKRAVG
jgi:Zn-dependent protease/CBS domain-containing protein